MFVFEVAVAFFLGMLVVMGVANSIRISKLAGRFNLTGVKYAVLHAPDIFVTIWQWGICNIIPCGSRFVNHTSLSDSELEGSWKQAQTNLATNQFPLNVFDTTDREMHLPDLRALNVTPKCVIVKEKSDVPVAELVKLDPKWATHSDPSQAFVLVGNSNTLYCHSYVSLYHRPRVYAVRSEVKACLEYEFENIILHILGYDTSMR